MAIGASLAPELETERLLWTLLAFALALGVGAHALDELNGRPLGTEIPAGVLVALAAGATAAAVTIGIGAALAWTPWLLAFVAFGAFVLPAYNLELLGGRFHNDVWFALAWGAFPVLTAYVAAAERLAAPALLAAAAAGLLSAAQRILSTEVRTVRRRAARVEGAVLYRDGSQEPLGADRLLWAPERALKALAAAVVALGAALVVFRLA
ncbi:MAG: hypothetical protein ICV64_10345 [Thermoleophilia bacterium]|nr:hypothetical protein [Thermoleophilia bacterium]